MKKYYIRRTDFYNAYSLCWADDAHPIPESAGWERITRREAEQLCRVESDRRMWEPASANYAPQIRPAVVDAGRRSRAGGRRLVHHVPRRSLPPACCAEAVRAGA